MYTHIYPYTYTYIHTHVHIPIHIDVHMNICINIVRKNPPPPVGCSLSNGVQIKKSEEEDPP